jgi:hypothetical protein
MLHSHHSWKVIFESDHRLFELIFSACSAKEEEGWRTCLLERSAADIRDLDDGHTARLRCVLDVNTGS